MTQKNTSIIILAAMAIVAVIGIFGYQYLVMPSNKNPESNQVTTHTCSDLYWFDNASTDIEACQTPKQFCDTYMYPGLQTFDNQEDCLIAFNGVQGK